MEKYLDDFNSLIESSKIKKESTFGYMESKNIKASTLNFKNSMSNYFGYYTLEDNNVMNLDGTLSSMSKFFIFKMKDTQFTNTNFKFSHKNFIKNYDDSKEKIKIPSDSILRKYQKMFDNFEEKMDKIKPTNRKIRFIKITKNLSGLELGDSSKDTIIYLKNVDLKYIKLNIKEPSNFLLVINNSNLGEFKFPISTARCKKLIESNTQPDFVEAIKNRTYKESKNPGFYLLKIREYIKKLKSKKEKKGLMNPIIIENEKSVKGLNINNLKLKSESLNFLELRKNNVNASIIGKDILFESPLNIFNLEENNFKNISLQIKLKAFKDSGKKESSGKKKIGGQDTVVIENGIITGGTTLEYQQKLVNSAIQNLRRIPKNDETVHFFQFDNTKLNKIKFHQESFKYIVLYLDNVTFNELLIEVKKNQNIMIVSKNSIGLIKLNTKKDKNISSTDSEENSSEENISEEDISEKKPNFIESIINFFKS